MDPKRRQQLLGCTHLGMSILSASEQAQQANFEFNPNQERAANGRFGSGGGSAPAADDKDKKGDDGETKDKDAKVATKTPGGRALPPEEKESVEDWKKNGIRSKAFKSWFGDWEKDPASASKVVDPKTGEPQVHHTMPENAAKVDPEAKPIIMYHGTPRGALDEF